MAYFFLILLNNLSGAIARAENAEVIPNDKYESNNFVTDACTQDSFVFDKINVEASDVVNWYTNWSRNELQDIKHLYNDEIDAISRRLLGAPNVKCSVLDAGCSSLPDCQDIAENVMDLEKDIPLTEDQQLQLRRRYFLSLMISSHSQYILATYNGITSSQIDMQRRCGELTRVFSAHAKGNVLRSCSVKQGIKVAAIATGVAIMAALIIIGSAFFFPVSVAGSIGTVAIPTIMTTVVSISQQWAQQLNYSLAPASPLGHRSLGGWGQLDTSTCANSMDNYQEQQELNENQLQKQVDDVFASLENSLKENANAFGNSNMDLDAKDNLTVLGQQLQTYNWALAWDMRNTLAEYISDNLTNAITERLVSDILIASKCYIQCSDAFDASEAYHHCSKESRTGPAVADNSFHALATFCPNRELCDDSEPNCARARFLEYENLVCRFACLNVDRGKGTFEDGGRIRPEWPEFLKEMENMEFYPMKPNKMFSEAVLNHQFERRLKGNWEKNESTVLDLKNFNPRLLTPMFRLPVCISDYAFGLSDPPKEDMWENRQFQPTCGDWKASETGPFLQALGLGNTTEHFQNRTFTRFFRKELRNTDERAGPITSFLTYCNVGVPWPDAGVWSYDEPLLWTPLLAPNSTSANYQCAEVMDAIIDMNELTANFWYCDPSNPITTHLLEFERKYIRMVTAGGEGHCKAYIDANEAAYMYWLNPQPLGPFHPDNKEAEIRRYEKEWERFFGSYQPNATLDLKYDRLREETWRQNLLDEAKEAEQMMTFAMLTNLNNIIPTL